MGSIWDDRLAEVWAAPGKAGAGVVVGSEGVLTARHVVEGALGESGGRVLARVVRSGHPTVPWVTMRAVVDIPEWDVALLVVDDRADERDLWLTPGSPCPVVVGLGASAEPGCEATGFPEAAVQHGSAPDPSATVRQSEQVRGTVLPTGQGKSPVHPDRALPRRWMPLDVESATSGTQAGWGGMSGAGVVLPPPDGRLTGLVVAAEAGHEQRRLYVVPLADVLVDVSRLATGLTEVVRGRVRIEVRDAPRYRDVLYESCLGPDGAPQKITRETDLATFGTGIVGVKPADIADEPKYLNYVPRDADDDLRRALQEARQNRQMLLVVGESAAGKSRSTAEAMRDRLTGYRLLHPRPNTLPEAVGLSSTEPQPAVVWLDDAQHYAHTALGDSLGRLLQAGVAVVGTIRRPELDLLAPTGDLRNPAGEALNARTLVRQHPWRLEWSEGERRRVTDHVIDRATRDAVSKGVPLGAWAVAGPQLVARLDEARADEAFPCRYGLIESVLAWYRTGIGVPVPRDVAIANVRPVVGLDCRVDEIDDALAWCGQSVIGRGRLARYALVHLDEANDTLIVDDYVLNHDQHRQETSVPDAVWSSALQRAASPEARWGIIGAAFSLSRNDVAFKALEPLAAAGDIAALWNLGTLLSTQQRLKRRSRSTTSSWPASATTPPLQCA